MPIDDPNELDGIDREIRINELKEQAAELTGGQMANWESPDCPPEVAEQFWEQVVRYEKGPFTTHYQQLVERGLELPPSEQLNDQQVSAKLCEVVGALAELRAFLTRTNHLSDRALYEYLLNDGLREEVPGMPFDEFGAWHIDLLGSGSEEDNALYLKYYGDEEYRARWKQDFPTDPIPPHEDPPYDRDHHLPQASYGPPPELDFDAPGGDNPFGPDEPHD